jgi:hypothetical protein
MNKPKSYIEIADAAKDVEVPMLELFIERLEVIQNDVGDLIRAMDRVRLDKLAVSQPAPQDFLAIKGKAANEKE